MVIEYMKTHDDPWPRTWDDLRDPYESLAAPQNYPWSFEDLKNRVAIDWDADPSALKNVTHSGNGPPFRVIWLRDDSSTCWGDTEPDARVLEYLKPARLDTNNAKSWHLLSRHIHEANDAPAGTPLGLLPALCVGGERSRIRAEDVSFLRHGR